MGVGEVVTGDAPTVPVDAGASTGTREARRESFQERLKVHFRFLFYIALGVHLTFGTLSVVRGASLTFVVFHFAVGVIAVLGLVWWWLARGARPLVALRAVDVVINVGTTLALAAVPMSWTADEAADMPLTGMTTYTLVLIVLVRSALVPSHLLYTAAVNVAMAAPTLYMLVVTPATHPFIAADHRGVGFEVGWVLMFVVACTAMSHLIWRLRERVREAEQLGQYRLVEKLGEGGMGIVYRASHTMLRRDTAVKLLRPDQSGEKSLERFEREVQMTAQLTHPNTVHIYDYGRTPDGVFYYAMELLDGVDLAALVDREGPLPPGRVVHLLEQVCGALEEAHGLGLVHRDIKPANIFLCRSGGLPDVAKVLDFGLVKVRMTEGESDERSLTGINQIVGTPQYMAPEGIARPEAQDARSDLYALGATAFFLLTGEPLFAAGSIVEVCGHHLHTAPDAPSARLGQDLGEDLDEVVLRCLEKDPEERWPSARALADALATCDASGTWDRDEATAWWERFDASSGGETVDRSSSRSMMIDLADR